MDLKLDQRKYRVFMDDSYAVETDTEARREKWRYYEVRGPRHMVYPYSLDRLALYMQTSMTEHRNFNYPGWTLFRDGDEEVVWLLPNKDFEIAAKLARAYKKRILSEEQKNRLANAGSKYRFTALKGQEKAISGLKTKKTSNLPGGGV
jgi:hypothetical protein